MDYFYNLQHNKHQLLRLGITREERPRGCSRGGEGGTSEGGGGERTGGWINRNIVILTLVAVSLLSMTYSCLNWWIVLTVLEGFSSPVKVHIRKKG